MKSKILLLVGMFACVSAYGEMDYIDMQIQELEQRRDELKKQIAECEQNTRGYKIAGIATLGATGVGVVGNIKLHNEIKKIEQSKSGGVSFGGGVSSDVLKTDTRTVQQKISAECEYHWPCDEYCELHYECPDCPCN